MSEWKRGPRRTPWLIISTSTPNKVALVRGRDAHSVCVALSPPDVPPVRSSAGGWIVSLSIVEDLRAYGRHIGEMVIVHEFKGAK